MKLLRLSIIKKVLTKTKQTYVKLEVRKSTAYVDLDQEKILYNSVGLS